MYHEKEKKEMVNVAITRDAHTLLKNLVRIETDKPGRWWGNPTLGEEVGKLIRDRTNVLEDEQKEKEAEEQEDAESTDDPD
jgi:hypothetical protein